MCGCYRTDIAHSRLSRLLHDIPELAGKEYLAFARHNIYFYRQSIPADACPCKPADYTDLVVFVLFSCSYLRIPRKSYRLALVTLTVFFPS